MTTERDSLAKLEEDIHIHHQKGRAMNSTELNDFTDGYEKAYGNGIIARALRELADIKDAAGKGVTDEIIQLFKKIYESNLGFYKTDTPFRKALEAVAPMLTADLRAENEK